MTSFDAIEELRRRSGNLRPADVISIAVELGYTYEGVGGGGHYVLTRPGGRPVTIPNHRVLKRGTALAILRQIEAALPAEEEYS